MKHHLLEIFFGLVASSVLFQDELAVLINRILVAIT